MRSLPLSVSLVGLSMWGAAPAGPLNDTGSDFCRNHTNNADTAVTATITCTPMPTHGGQDARYGRDPAAQRGVLPKVGGGSKGFDFTKIANDGSLLPASATPGNAATDWACTYDNNTGLMWEVKVNDDTHLRHQGWTYTWYDSLHNYGGNPGTADTVGGGGVCATDGRCDTEQFIADVNAGAGLCGHTDWRMPTLQELYNLADRGISSHTGNPTIDSDYFPNTPAAFFWSGSPVVTASDSAFGVLFSAAFGFWDLRSGDFPVRLVRAGL